MEEFNLETLTALFINSFQELLNQLIIWLPKVLIALILWWLGRALLNFAISWIAKIDIPGTNIDNRLISKFNRVLQWLGNFLLALIILDYLGIGQTVIGAIANGLTLSVALTLGIAFGQALRPDAETTVANARKLFQSTTRKNQPTKSSRR